MVWPPTRLSQPRMTVTAPCWKPTRCKMIIRPSLSFPRTGEQGKASSWNPVAKISGTNLLSAAMNCWIMSGTPLELATIKWQLDLHKIDLLKHPTIWKMTTVAFPFFYNNLRWRICLISPTDWLGWISFTTEPNLLKGFQSRSQKASRALQIDFDRLSWIMKEWAPNFLLYPFYLFRSIQ